jgi:hypothetical protein
LADRWSDGRTRVRHRRRHDAGAPEPRSLDRRRRPHADVRRHHRAPRTHDQFDARRAGFGGRGGRRDRPPGGGRRGPRARRLHLRINDHRYSDAFALFSSDNATARKGLEAWEAAESTTQIRDARLLSVRDAAPGSVTAGMTFTSTQDAQFGPDGQTCSQWDLVYDMSGPGPNWQIHRVSTRADPKPC